VELQHSDPPPTHSEHHDSTAAQARNPGNPRARRHEPRPLMAPRTAERYFGTPSPTWLPSTTSVQNGGSARVLPELFAITQRDGIGRLRVADSVQRAGFGTPWCRCNVALKATAVAIAGSRSCAALVSSRLPLRRTGSEPGPSPRVFISGDQRPGRSRGTMRIRCQRSRLPRVVTARPIK
jgi:hypothetical protein